MKKITTITFSIIVVGILNNSVLAQENTTNDSEIQIQEQKPVLNPNPNTQAVPQNSVPPSRSIGIYNIMSPGMLPADPGQLRTLDPDLENRCHITREQKIQSQKMLDTIKRELNSEEFEDFLANEPKNCEVKKLAYRKQVHLKIFSIINNFDY
ncbi:MAG: hypothetical protein QNJ55_27205 [Xenococcus sp. MO_188.B8]|nr:hypothetical protein [Xenococcus sp. MO_188.B8]